jgi:hypothetical protein
MNRPYGGGQYQYPMKMIRHYHPFVQFDFVADFGGFDPFIGNHPSCHIQFHYPIHDFPEQAFPVLGADGDEIHPSLGVVVSLQPDETAVSSGLGRPAGRPYVVVIVRHTVASTSFSPSC